MHTENFNYLIACPETGEALAIDPLDYGKCLSKAKDKGWEITQILNTHEHGDHTGGNHAVIEATGAKLIAHENAQGKIEGIDQGLKSGDVVKVGKSAELLALDTPGHTMSPYMPTFKKQTLPLYSQAIHYLMLEPETVAEEDILKNFMKTFVSQLEKLADNTLIYPGHDYITNNLGFYFRS
ncbi:MAG: hypothetical protein Ct9H300mP20_11120 [Gammaproteobacteria bacterium]|nr:MAG: hypothetical protein Ct9H300mP20_11120 [Gammaproteobacteria bacterium]